MDGNRTRRIAAVYKAGAWLPCIVVGQLRHRRKRSPSGSPQRRRCRLRLRHATTSAGREPGELLAMHQFAAGESATGHSCRFRAVLVRSGLPFIADIRRRTDFVAMGPEAAAARRPISFSSPRRTVSRRPEQSTKAPDLRRARPWRSTRRRGWPYPFRSVSPGVLGAVRYLG